MAVSRLIKTTGAVITTGLIIRTARLVITMVPAQIMEEGPIHHRYRTPPVVLITRGTPEAAMVLMVAAGPASATRAPVVAMMATGITTVHRR